MIGLYEHTLQQKGYTVDGVVSCESTSLKLPDFHASVKIPAVPRKTYTGHLAKLPKKEFRLH
jgi:hypothetical protein